jgi:hypothetical protein
MPSTFAIFTKYAMSGRRRMRRGDRRSSGRQEMEEGKMKQTRVRKRQEWKEREGWRRSKKWRQEEERRKWYTARNSTEYSYRCSDTLDRQH